MTRYGVRPASVAVSALLAVALAGCATMRAGSHVARGATMSQYLTWDWAAAEERPTGDPRLDSNPMFDTRLRKAIEHQLAGKRFIRTTLAGTPDLRAQYHVNFSKTIAITNRSPTTGACSGDCAPDAYAYEQGTLVVDLVDARTNTLVWRGWSWDNMDGVIDNQDLMDREIDRIVAAMFDRLPSAP